MARHLPMLPFGPTPTMPPTPNSDPRYPRQNFMDPRHRRQDLTNATQAPMDPRYQRHPRTHATHAI